MAVPAVYIGQEKHDERPVSNDRVEDESSCSAPASARNWHELARQALTKRCRFHPRTHHCERVSHVASTVVMAPLIHQPESWWKEGIKPHGRMNSGNAWSR